MTREDLSVLIDAYVRDAYRNGQYDHVQGETRRGWGSEVESLTLAVELWVADVIGEDDPATASRFVEVCNNLRADQRARAQINKHSNELLRGGEDV